MFYLFIFHHSSGFFFQPKQLTDIFVFLRLLTLCNDVDLFGIIKSAIVLHSFQKPIVNILSNKHIHYPF